MAPDFCLAISFEKGHMVVLCKLFGVAVDGQKRPAKWVYFSQEIALCLII